MNTILTDDELPPLQPQDHPEPHSFAWTEQEMRAIRARDRLVEAAVLAKLQHQQTQWQQRGDEVMALLNKSLWLSAAFHLGAWWAERPWRKED